MADVALDEDDLNKDEMEAFEAAWDVLSVEWHKTGKIEVWNDQQKAWALMAIQVYKHDRGGKIQFEGTNVRSGFGIRKPYPEDCVGLTSILWDFTWGTTGPRLWMGGDGAGTGVDMDNATFAAGGMLKLQDSGLNLWSLVFWGIRSMHPSPKVKAFTIEIDTNHWNEIPVEQQMRNSELRKADFDEVFLIRAEHSFKTGLVWATGQLGIDSIYPEGLCIFDSQRAQLTKTALNTKRPAGV